MGDPQPPQSNGTVIMDPEERERNSLPRSIDFVYCHEQVHVLAAHRFHPKLQLHMPRKLGPLVDLEIKLCILYFTIIGIAHVITDLCFVTDRRLAQGSVAPVQEQLRVLGTGQWPFVFVPESSYTISPSGLEHHPRPVLYFAIDAF